MSTLKKVLLGVILLTAVAVSGVHSLDIRHFSNTGRAPGSPKIKKNRLTFQRSKGNSLSIHICYSKRRSCVSFCFGNMEIKFILLSSTSTAPNLMQLHLWKITLSVSLLRLIRMELLLQPMPFRPYQQVTSLMLTAMLLTAMSAH